MKTTPRILPKRSHNRSLWYNDGMNDKVKTSYTLTATAVACIEAVSSKLGVSRTSAVEIAVRKLAEQENISVFVNCTALHNQGTGRESN